MSGDSIPEWSAAMIVDRLTACARVAFFAGGLALFGLAATLRQADAHAGILGQLSGLDGTEETSPAEGADQNAPREEMIEKLQALQELLRTYKFQDAYASVKEMAGLPDLRPGEAKILLLLSVMAAANADDPKAAVAAYDRASMQGLLNPVRTVDFSDDITGAFYRRKDFRDAVFWGRRYVTAGGKENRVIALLAHAEYETGDFAAAEKNAAALTGAATAAGAPVEEPIWQLLANSAIKLKHYPQAISALEKLVAVDPRPDYCKVLAEMFALPQAHVPAGEIERVHTACNGAR